MEGDNMLLSFKKQLTKSVDDIPSVSDNKKDLVPRDVILHSDGSAYVFDREVDEWAFIGHRLGSPQTPFVLQYVYFQQLGTNHINILTRMKNPSIIK